MAFPAFPTYPPPSWPVNVTRKPAALNSKFGDNYEQDVGDGINAANILTANLTWTNMPTSEKDTLEAFLTAPGGLVRGRFTFTLPGWSTQMTFKCEEWSWSNPEYNFHTLNATFIRQFDVG